MTAREERCSCLRPMFHPDYFHIKPVLTDDRGPITTIDPNCPVHSKGGGQNNEQNAPDVAEPRGAGKDCQCWFGADGEWHRCLFHHDQARSNAPGPTVHHDETRGYHTADGRPVEAMKAWQAKYANHINSTWSENRADELMADAIAEIERLEKESVQLRDALYRIALLEAENTKLREFFEAVFEDAWGLYLADGGDLQDTAERLGLIVRVPADERFRDEYDADEMFVWSWHPLALEGKCNS